MDSTMEGKRFGLFFGDGTLEYFLKGQRKNFKEMFLKGIKPGDSKRRLSKNKWDIKKEHYYLPKWFHFSHPKIKIRKKITLLEKERMWEVSHTVLFHDLIDTNFLENYKTLVYYIL